MSVVGSPQVVYNDKTGNVEVRIPLADGTGDHLLAVLPATPPPDPAE